jgi:hypothetical protein
VRGDELGDVGLDPRVGGDDAEAEVAAGHACRTLLDRITETDRPGAARGSIFVHAGD